MPSWARLGEVPAGRRGSGLAERADPRRRERRPRLDRLPPGVDARMLRRRYLVRRDLLVEALDERYGGDVGDRIARAQEPHTLIPCAMAPRARRQHRLHAVEQPDRELVPRLGALLLGVGFACGPEPRLAPLPAEIGRA